MVDPAVVKNQNLAMIADLHNKLKMRDAEIARLKSNLQAANNDNVTKQHSSKASSALWILVCNSCGVKMNKVRQSALRAVQRYNETCVLANHVYAVYCANMQALRFAHTVAQYMDVDKQIDDIANMITEIRALKAEFVSVLNASARSRVAFIA